MALVLNLYCDTTRYSQIKTSVFQYMGIPDRLKYSKIDVNDMPNLVVESKLEFMYVYVPAISDNKIWVHPSFINPPSGQAMLVCCHLYCMSMPNALKIYGGF